MAADDVIRVLVADDQELMRSALGTVIDVQPDMRLVGSVPSGEDAVREALAVSVDVALLDIRMARMDGIEACAEIRRHRPDTRVLMLTTFDLDEYLFRSVAAGASGFLTKDTPGADVAGAIREVHSGRSVVSPRATRALIDRIARAAPDAAAVAADLSPRERDVLALLARGFSNAEIARELFVAESTVKTHVSSLTRKVGVRDRLHVVVWAYRNGIF
ncbi:two component transcriptional regulator, LuxR family [Beutenbergia cavernae DSM 12333]|uniref:Two component transcriptional regulator, LuxR family n=1 Tax=Beutenbergia cavernae (strain ATCC BAA-8 / DSM 12333 / CCUG 43141 / JCM 11478 / NBRC 16432 / NCIMB 13614 / HKI 0122) TaxID=471853 RepID=C5C4U8_BEUC1|nr:response regulator transcription factor [Beutenbergia cavernae]ACQ80076.1 two component transcriptional regulator, LuxR family [Beutenbergia cavernae DSM 12333]